MVFWPTLALLLVGLLVGLLGGAGYVFLRGRALWRQAQASGGVLAAEADRIASAADGIALQLERADEAGDRLRAANERFAETRGQLGLQLAALHEARAAVVRALRLPA